LLWLKGKCHEGFRSDDTPSHFGFTRNECDVLVRNGVVDLWGAADARHRNALKALVRSVGNVKRINDRLVSTRELT